ncbi:molybdopterin cofactor-binding domain-containing protein [candidate division KSB1 bacterium]
MKEDEYKDFNFSEVKAHSSINRREFLKRLGGGIIIFFTFGDASVLQGQRQNREYPEDFNAYLRIGIDGRVTCFTGKIEMGQGIVTSLAQMLADEIDVTLESVDMIMGDTDLCPWDMGTFGSRSIKYFGPALRAAAAEAKAVLITLAAEYLQKPQDLLKAKDGIIFDKTQNKNRITYAQLTKGKIIERHLKKKSDLKTASELNIMGKSFLRGDSLEKVTGKALYSGDIRLPDMLYAKILRPPVHGAKLKSVDTSPAKKISGVQIVHDNDLIAVLHKYPDEAEKALPKIKAQFDLPEARVDDKTIFDHLQNVTPEGDTAAEGGNIETGEKLASSVFEETYLNSYVAHAPIETHTATAKIEGNKATVWASTQAPFRIKDQIARALDFPSKNVRIITPFVGGGFGGKTRCPQAVEAAQLAKLTGKPVQVAWSRAEEFFYDTFRPAAFVKIKSGISDSGEITFWDYGVYFAGERGSIQFYDVPHHRTVVYGGWGGTPGSHPFPTGAWRGPAVNTNTFARESHIDIMASNAGIDPLEFRLKNLSDKRMLRVLRAAAEKFGWIPSKAPSGRGYGIACVDYLNTYVTAMAEVDVDEKRGSVQVKRIVCAQDMGLVINPEGAKQQIEGALTMGLGYALTEEIHFKSGEIFDLNFDTYEIPRFSWLPKIETVLIDNTQLPPQGGGEPAITCVGGLIANAIYDAAGVRLFQLPMIPKRINEAMKNN